MRREYFGRHNITGGSFIYFLSFVGDPAHNSQSINHPVYMCARFRRAVPAHSKGKFRGENAEAQTGQRKPFILTHTRAVCYNIS